MKNEKKINQILSDIENLTYENNTKIGECDIISILKLIKSELELSGKVTMKRAYDSDDFNDLVEMLDKIQLEIQASSND